MEGSNLAENCRAVKYESRMHLRSHFQRRCARERWKSLRDTYTRIARCSKLTTGTKFLKTKYKYADELSFLRGIKEGRKYYSSDDDTFQNDETNNDDEDVWGPLPSPKRMKTPNRAFARHQMKPLPLLKLRKMLNRLSQKLYKNVAIASLKRAALIH
ncbi:PREDICTED: uncharacterized protein LOC108371014 [Rhagoletis zephyria]|uniref:uncharacterized protein LOC108371014 n=1 Tax=Rhagoletis zephyria TaxID=28612 RepID=UPI0008119B47|nr:PREDICTED: uncharacterized protein LOC108371014 [Rhagoletis zephyria]